MIKISESYKSSVNWTEYNKWLEEGKPFEEHEEIELFINRGNGSSQGQVSAGTERCSIVEKREPVNGVRSHCSKWKANQKARKKSYYTPPSAGSKTATRNDHEHHGKILGLNEQITKDSDNERNDEEKEKNTDEVRSSDNVIELE
ncbi:hypothetical protein GLOIN_2v1774321 [Rhizophagus clarus]|uniref:Uncharacterized protein n=1 Tax=Rhizophagus clarus TaxID=94130 RepID=A0A8H3L6G0_9GLOM|nr:hypothetical protein GLOIN_2v1774321 [Rhizophagus clarus]